MRPRTGHRSSWNEDGAAIEATGPTLPILFDEAGMALADLTAAFDAGAPASSWEPVQLAAEDLPGLAGTWLNELIREAAARNAELVDVGVDTVTAPADGTADAWRLRGRVGLRALFGRHGPARHDLRARPGAQIETLGGGWALHARLDPAPDRTAPADRSPSHAGGLVGRP